MSAVFSKFRNCGRTTGPFAPACGLSIDATLISLTPVLGHRAAMVSSKHRFSRKSSVLIVRSVPPRVR